MTELVWLLTCLGLTTQEQKNSRETFVLNYFVSHYELHMLINCILPFYMHISNVSDVMENVQWVQCMSFNQPSFVIICFLHYFQSCTRELTTEQFSEPQCMSKVGSPSQCWSLFMVIDIWWTWHQQCQEQSDITVNLRVMGSYLSKHEDLICFKSLNNSYWREQAHWFRFRFTVSKLIQ